MLFEVFTEKYRHTIMSPLETGKEIGLTPTENKGKKNLVSDEKRQEKERKMKDEVGNKTGVQKISINPDHIIWTPYQTEYISSWGLKTYIREEEKKQRLRGSIRK